jgi:teichoic acid ribitol-phosphate primase
VTGLALPLRIAVGRAGFALGRLLPIRRRVVLATSHADRLGGNLVAIRDELGRRMPSERVVVFAFRHRSGMGGRIAALWHALRSGFHLATARVFVVDDYFFALYVIHPRPGTIRVQVWHAAGAFKRFGYSVLDRSFGADEALVERVPIHANYDLCLVSAAAVAPHYAEAFRVPLDRFTSAVGVPRTDLFFDDARRARVEADVRRRYRIPAGRRVVLYAPTFRGDSVTAARDAEFLDLRALADVIGDDHVVLLRLHPFIRRRTTLDPDLAGFAVDVSDHPDINELMLVSDVLVTDYSSVIFEFALLGRPIAFLAPDREAYVGERGFYLDFPADMPGPVFETTTALAAYLRAGTFDTARVEAFARASFDLADGRASERFVELVVRPALDGNQPAVPRVGR